MHFTRDTDLYAMNMKFVHTLLFTFGLPALAATDIQTAVLLVNIPPACTISILSSRSTSDVVNSVSSGEILFHYAMRTSRSGGGGTIRLTSLDSGRSVTFSSEVSGAGVAASGEQTLGDSGVVARFPSNAHSGDSGESGAISWTAAGVSPPQWSLTVECQ
jgi:hypothetical protein